MLGLSDKMSDILSKTSDNLTVWRGRALTLTLTLTLTETNPNPNRNYLLIYLLFIYLFICFFIHVYFCGSVYVVVYVFIYCSIYSCIFASISQLGLLLCVSLSCSPLYYCSYICCVCLDKCKASHQCLDHRSVNACARVFPVALVQHRWVYLLCLTENGQVWD